MKKSGCIEVREIALQYDQSVSYGTAVVSEMGK